MKTETYTSPTQPWLANSRIDGLFILAPPFFALLVVAFFPGTFKTSAAMPLPYWVLLIVMIDVAHVYSTLFRTYFKPHALKQQPVLGIIPVACYFGGIALYAINGMLFWRVLAYLAVFHFIRQQYGFMRLYSRKEVQTTLSKYVDAAAIYMATVYPLVYWHLVGGRKFNWFISGDFLLFSLPYALTVFTVIYLLIIIIYTGKEVWLLKQRNPFNIPRNVLVIGTFLSWYVGIIYFNGDMAFTTLNVVSHGIPYIALVWIIERQKINNAPLKPTKLYKLAFNKYTGVLVFLAVIVLFAYLEEGLWDGLIWREHLHFFTAFRRLPQLRDEVLLAFLIPLLALPQSTHYVLDGFIWKLSKSKKEQVTPFI